VLSLGRCLRRPDLTFQAYKLLLWPILDAMDRSKRETEQASGNTEIGRDGSDIVGPERGEREGGSGTGRIWGPERGEQTSHKIESIEREQN
jgi:hypothetical protein